MPNYLDPFSRNYQVGHNPLNTLAVDPLKFIGEIPSELELLAEILVQAPLNLLDSIIGAINYTLGIQLPNATQALAGIKQFLKPFGLTFCHPVHFASPAEAVPTSDLSPSSAAAVAAAEGASQPTDDQNAVAPAVDYSVHSQNFLDTMGNPDFSSPTYNPVAQIPAQHVTGPVTDLHSDFGATLNSLYGNPAVIGAVTVNSQAIADAVHQAVNGGSATGTPIGSILDNLQQIPAKNITPPPNPNASGLVYDSASGETDIIYSGVFVKTDHIISWTHTVGADADFAVMVIGYNGAHTFYAGLNPVNDIKAVTFAGQNMIPLGSHQNPVGTAAMAVYSLGLGETPSGAQPVSVTFNSEGAGINQLVSCEVVTFTSVGSVGALTLSHLSNGVPYESDVWPAGTTVLNSFYAHTNNGSSAAMSGYSQTQLITSGSFGVGSDSACQVIGIGSGGGSSSTTFSTTTPSASDDVMIAAFAMTPLPAVAGSYAFVAKTSGTTSSFSTGMVPNNTFDATPSIISDDITYSQTNSHFTVSYTGTYHFEFSLAWVYASQSQQHIDAVCYVTRAGGSPFQYKICGQNDLVLGSGNYVLFGSCDVYLNAGDSVAPGWIFSSGAAVSSNAVGTWMSLGLSNRSYL